MCVHRSASLTCESLALSRVHLVAVLTACSIFNFQKAYAVRRTPGFRLLSTYNASFHAQILDELIIAGELQETSKKSVLRVVRLASLTLHLVSDHGCVRTGHAIGQRRRAGEQRGHPRTARERRSVIMNLFFLLGSLTGIYPSAGISALANRAVRPPVNYNM